MNIFASRSIVLLAAFALAACAKPAADTRPRVLVSNPPIAWLVRQIAGDKVVVQTLAPAGGCGHGFQPTDAELAEAAKAQVWFTVGLEFEDAGWTKELQGKRHPLALKDSHAWMSLPLFAEIGTREIAGDPVCGIPERSREFPVIAAMRQKHEALLKLLAPLKGQAFLADHPAYAHFAADYGLKQLAVEDDGHEASDARLTQLISEAKRAQAKVLFLAEECNRPLAETVAKAVGAKVVAADPNEENTPELLERMANELSKAHAGKEPRP